MRIVVGFAESGAIILVSNPDRDLALEGNPCEHDRSVVKPAFQAFFDHVLGGRHGGHHERNSIRPVYRWLRMDRASESLPHHVLEKDLALLLDYLVQNDFLVGRVGYSYQIKGACSAQAGNLFSSSLHDSLNRLPDTKPPSRHLMRRAGQLHFTKTVRICYYI